MAFDAALWEEKSKKRAIRVQQTLKREAITQKMRSEAVSAGMQQGMSWEDIAKKTKVPLSFVQSYSQQVNPNYGIKPTDTRSNIQKAGGLAKGLGEALASSYNRVGTGVAEVLGSDAQARANQAVAQADEVSTDIVRKAALKLQDPNIPEAQKKRIRELVKSITGQTEKAFNQNNAIGKEIQDRTDPVKGAAAVGSIGFDVLTAGTVGSATKAAARSATANLARKVATGAAQGAVGGGLGAVEQQGRDVTLGDITKGAVTGAALGGGLTVGGAAAGAGFRKASNRIKGIRGVDIDRLTSYEGAPDRAAVEAYKAKIQAGEPIEPLVVKKDSLGNLGVEDGKHRLQAYKELGMTNVPTIGDNTKIPPRPKNVQDVTRQSGKVSGELDSALANVDDPDTALRLRAAFGQKTKQKTEAVAKRTGEQTTRANQFYDTAEREVIDQIENDPAIARSGQVQTQADTLAAAAQRGPMDLTNLKVGAKVDAVDVARARLTMSSYIDDYKKAINSGDSKTIKVANENLAKAREGYQLLTGEAGRALNIQSTFDNKMMEVFDVASDYQSTIAGGTPLTKGQTDYMNALLKDAVKEMDVTRMDKLKGAVYAGDQSLVRKAEEYATAAKLTSPTTHIRNIIGNTLTFGQRAVEQTVATGIGAARGRTSVRAIPAVLGSRSGYKEATSKFWGILKDAAALRRTSDNLAAGEGFKPAINGKVGEFIRIPFKFLEAADEFGKTVLRDSRLHQEAFDLATKEGFKGDALTGRVTELIQNPTKKMVADAQKDALEFTFQKDLGQVGKSFQNIVSHIPGGKFFIPFIKTPTNIVKFQLNRSVVGAPGQLVKGFAKRGTREGDEAIARAITGTALSLGTYAWVKDNVDNITGAAPKSAAERDAFYAEGKQPYSIKIGDNWVSYQNFQPVGLYLLQAKSLDDAIANKDNKGAVAIASSMAQVAAKGLLELPFVQGMSNIVEALADPEAKAEDFVGNVVKGTIPNALRDIRLYQDDVVRAPRGLKQQVYDMIPGLSDDLPARTTVLGESATRKDSALARSLFRVFGTKEQIPREEFEVLKGVAKNTDYTISTPGRTQRGKKLAQDEYNAYTKAYYTSFADKLRGQIATPGFQSMSWDDKKKVIEDIVRVSGDETRDKFFGSN